MYEDAVRSRRLSSEIVVDSSGNAVVKKLHIVGN